MGKSMKYVIKEHLNNVYRIFSIARYEIVSENRESKLGPLWNILNPLILICTYWFVFGMGIRNNLPVQGIPYLHWMLVGMVVWFFMSGCIRRSTNSIQSKIGILEKIKFPVSILPATSILCEVFEHMVMAGIVYIFIILQGFEPSVQNFQVIYYFICALAFGLSFGLTFSVLSVLIKDIRKIIPSVLRILMFITPVLWTMDNLPDWAQTIMRLNPIYYVVEGYRSSILGLTTIGFKSLETVFFWSITGGLFITGCFLMNKYRSKFVDIG